MLTRILGAAVRAVCVAFMLAAPSLLMASAGDGNREIISLMALAVGAFVFIEYASVAPSLLEFREAPPFNRARFLALSVTLVLLSVVMGAGESNSPLQDLLFAVGFVIGDALDFAYSPVRLLVLSLGEGASLAELVLLRTAAGLSMFISLIALGCVLMVLRLSDWPSGRGTFNVWVNLPTFAGSNGRDIVERLQWDGRINIGLGVLLPFIVPVLIRVADAHVLPAMTLTPHSIVWIVAGWSFLPLALVMRGVALTRIANMIADRRRRASIEGKGARIFAL